MTLRNTIKALLLSLPLAFTSCSQPVAAKGLPHVGVEKKFMGTKEEFCFDVADMAKTIIHAAKTDYPIERAKEILQKDKLENLYYKYHMANLYDAYGGYKSFSEGYFQQRAYLNCMSQPLIRSTWDLNN
jgi:hypothetical protein